MSKKIKIIAVDDHNLFRESLVFSLGRNNEFEIVAEASNGLEAISEYEKHKPDLVLMDILMPELDGIEATRKIIEKHPDAKIIALTMFGEEEFYHKMINLGVKGFVLKQSSFSELETAIIMVSKGDFYFSQDLLRKVILKMSDKKTETKKNINQVEELTKREIELIQLICKGNSNAEIAEIMFVSPRTVEGYKTKLLDKTSSKNIASLIIFAVKNNLIDI